MVWTSTSRLVPGVFLLAITVAAPATGKDTLSVAANVPAVPLAPRNPGRNFVRLPTLEYTFEIQTSCSASGTPESLSLNVADTHKSLSGDQIVIDGPTEISLRIPASQLAPLVIEEFCVQELEENGDRPGTVPTQITIPAALSAQISLLCASDEDKAITYVSRTLDVTLVCEWSAEDEESGESGAE